MGNTPGTLPRTTHGHARTQRIAVLSFEPFALWAREQTLGTLAATHPLATTGDGKRIADVDIVAEQAGVHAGMTLAGAQQRLPSLEILPNNGPEIEAAWDAHLDGLLAFSPRIESLRLGVAALQADERDAHHLAESCRGRVGLADTTEVAWLLAYGAQAGTVCSIASHENPWSYLDDRPVALLREVGLSVRDLERLRWLGVTTLGGVRRWKPAQFNAFFGPSADLLRPLLHGPHRARVALRPPPRIVHAEEHFEDTVREPAILDPALELLVQRASDALAGQSAQRIRVIAYGAGVRSEGVRRAKTPLRDPARLLRLARHALEDSGLAPLGIDLLRVELSGLSRPNEAGTLWLQRRRLMEAAESVHARFPGQARSFALRDAAALRAHLRWRLQDATSQHDLDADGPTEAQALQSESSSHPLPPSLKTVPSS